MKLAGQRLIHIMCKMTDGRFELIYSYDRNGATDNLHVFVNEGEEVESVSDQYAFAFLYENEIKELFGVNVVNISLDFGGNLYQTSVKRAFNPEKSAGGESQ